MSHVPCFGVLIITTREAALIDFGLDESTWVPKSLFDNDNPDWDSIPDGTKDEWNIAEWFAKKEGLI